MIKFIKKIRQSKSSSVALGRLKTTLNSERSSSVSFESKVKVPTLTYNLKKKEEDLRKNS